MKGTISMASTKGGFKPSNNYAVIYCRVSSEAQATADKVSLDEQEARGKATAKRYALDILYIVKDAESAWIMDKRSKFQAVLTDARARKFGWLIVDRPNRFTRSEDVTDAMIVKRQLQDAGVKVVFSTHDFGDGPLGQLMELVAFWKSGVDQAERREQVREGKAGRAKKGHPIPGRRALYGFVWEPNTDKKWLIRDPGPAQSVMRQIWDYFLRYQPTPDHPRPTLHGVEGMLSDAHIPPPRVYQLISNKNGKMRSVGWCRQSLGRMLKDPRYWGEKKQALLASKYHDVQPPIDIDAYVRPGHAYVTPQEAARVHAMLGWNDEHVGRPPARDWGVLLNSGLAACGYCGKPLDPHSPKRKRRLRPQPDTGPENYYRCRTRNDHGSDPAKGGCSGVSIRADVLDEATIWALDRNLKREHFLENIFAAWEKDEGEAGDALRVTKSTLDQAESDLANLVVYAARTPPNTAAGAALQVQIDQLNELVPRLRARHENAIAAREKVRANTALADELRMWFDAWLTGFALLPLERQRQFLESLHAKVVVWREGEPTRVGLPRAELVIGLPTDVLTLPTPFPDDLAWMNVRTGPDGWHVPLDIEHVKEAVDAVAGGFNVALTPEEEAALDERRRAWDTASAAEVMRAVRDERGDQDDPGPKAAPSIR